MANLETITRIDPRVAEQPISLPDNLFIAKFKDLGVDEILAAFIDPLSTTAMRAIAPDATYILPFTGPIAEKGIFIARHALEANGVYKTTREKDRKPYNFYLKEGIKHGGQNVIKDIVYHDPIYTTLMAAGLALFPEVHPAFISVIDYAVSVPMAVALDVVIDSIRHKRNIHNLKKAGFKQENYYESRFYVLNEMDPRDALEGLMKEFNLENQGTVRYNDTYFDVDKKGLLGKEVKMRIRHRQKLGFEKNNGFGMLDAGSYHHDDEHMSTLQIVHTRAQEHKKNLDQCRYFPAKKEKSYAFINKDATDIASIADPHIRTIGKKLLIDPNKRQEVSFDREVMNNKDLSVCTDGIVNGNKRPFYVLELKSFDNTTRLRQAMRYVMMECPIVAVQTTYGKSELME